MKITVVGAGAIGGFLACKLFSSGCNVSLIARGSTLLAIQNNGLQLKQGDQLTTAKINVTDDPNEIGVQDIVIFAVKANSLPQAVESSKPLIGKDTIVIPALNGIPWWYFMDATALLSGTKLKCVDPQGKIEQGISFESIVGCVIFPSCIVESPGVIRHVSGSKIALGEPRGGESQRVSDLVNLFSAAGFDAYSHENIREEVWLKLLGNACYNPTSLLVGCTTDVLIDDLYLKDLIIEMMNEILELGHRIGISPDINPLQRIAITRKLGGVKTSMLQDMENHRPVEIEAILGTLVYIADEIQLPMVRTRTVYALTRIRAKFLGILP